LMPGNRLARLSAIPSRAFNNTHFYSRSPVTARSESFNQRAAQIQQMVQQHNPAGVSNLGARQGANSTGRFGNAGGAASGGYGSANRSGYTNSRPMAPSAQGQSSNSGWGQSSSRSPYSSQAQGGQSPRSFTNSSPYSTTRPQSAPGGYSQPRYGSRQQGNNQGAWQRFSAPSPSAPSARGGGWNAPAPRSQYLGSGWGRSWSSPGGQSYGGYGSRPSLNMRKPIVVERSTAPRSYGGGGSRGYSAPSGGGHESSGGGGHSAPSFSHGGGGGGGGHGRR
jgi:hypothetical protein